MATLTTIYWLCFGIGMVYLLISGTFGVVSHSLEAAGGDADFDFDHDADVDFDTDLDFDADADFDLDIDHDIDGGIDVDHDAAADHGHGHSAEVGAGSHDVFPSFNLLSPLSVAGFLSAFGGAGLISMAYKMPLAFSLMTALGGGMLIALALWLVIGKFLFGMQGSSEAFQSDMVGLEAEVITPMEDDITGEIAYILGGMRYTAPARLEKEGRAGRTEKVRIRRMKDNIAYIVQKKKLLN